MFVIDASRTLALCLEDERDGAAMLTLDRLETEGAVAPSIWPLEVSNGLRMAIRRTRISAGDLPRLRSLLTDLQVEIDPIDTRTAVGETLDLALAHDLTSYDAAYLALAMRRGIPIATSDGRLRAACTQVGVPLIG